MGGRTAVGAACALWIGVSAGAWVGGSLPGLVLAGLALSLVLRAPPRLGTVLALIACAGAGWSRGAAHVRGMETATTLLTLDRPVWIEARVVEPPTHGAGETRVTLALSRAGEIAPGTRVRVRLATDPGVQWGDRIRGLVRLDRLPGPRVPGGYDARRAAQAQGVVAGGTLWAAAIDDDVPGRWTRATIGRWRREVDRILEARLTTEARELTTPLVLGDRGILGPELAGHLQGAGLTHLIALSGVHVAWLAAIARGLAALAGMGPRARAACGMLCALGYLGLAGPVPSLARAVLAEVLTATARLRDRPIDGLQSLAVSVVLLVGLAPGWADDLGFQLSCAATLGLATLGRRPATEPPSRRFGGPWWAARRALADLLRPTLAAQFAVLPLVLMRFHAVSWTALLANLAGIPACELLLAAAWMGILLDGALPGSGQLLFAASDALVVFLRWLAAVAGGQPSSLLATGHDPGVAVAAALGVAIAVAAAAGPRDLAGRERIGSTRRGRLACGVGLVIAALLVAVGEPELRPPPGRWWIVVLDVGQGDAIAVGFPDGWWLVDAGPRTPQSDAGRRAVLPWMRWAPVRRLEALALTHEHSDHTGGARAILQSLPVGRLLVRAGREGSHAHPRRRAVARGDTLRRDPTVRVLWPPAGAGGGENPTSLVLEIGVGSGVALLAADVDSLVERGLDARAAAVVKVAHHGAATSSASSLAGRVRPRFAIVSCGGRNPFGHPDAGTLARWRAVGAEVLRTDRDGTVWIECAAGGVRRLDPGRLPEVTDPGRWRRPSHAPGPLAAAPARC